MQDFLLQVEFLNNVSLQTIVLSFYFSVYCFTYVKPISLLGYHSIKKYKNKNKNKPFGTHQVPLILGTTIVYFAYVVEVITIYTSINPNMAEGD